MKTKCTGCGRLVGVKKGVISKHRTGRSKPKPGHVKSVCELSGSIIHSKSVHTKYDVAVPVMSRKEIRAIKFAHPNLET